MWAFQYWNGQHWISCLSFQMKTYLESVVVSLSIYCRETTTYISTKSSYGILVIITLELLKNETRRVPILRGLCLCTAEPFQNRFELVSISFQKSFFEKVLFWIIGPYNRGLNFLQELLEYHLLHYQANHHPINNPKLL